MYIFYYTYKISNTYYLYIYNVYVNTLTSNKLITQNIHLLLTSCEEMNFIAPLPVLYKSH